MSEPPFPTELFEAAKLELGRFEVALGQLMLAWADTEAALYLVLVHYAGVSDAVGRALFSGLRAKAMADFVRNIAINTSMEKTRHEDLLFLFNQISAINSMRDVLVHHGSYGSIHVADPNSRYVSNARRAGKAKAVRIYKIGSETIMHMVLDLRQIADHLQRHYMPLPFVPHEGSGDTSTWLYKSLQPDSMSRKTRTIPKAQSRQPKPSPGK